MLKISLYSPAGGYLCYFKFAHSSTQTVFYYYIDIYLKIVILMLLWGAGKLKACKKIPVIQYTASNSLVCYRQENSQIRKGFPSVVTTLWGLSVAT